MYAIITGGNSGLGLAIAKRVAELGAEVVITGRRQERLEAAMAAIGRGCKGYIVMDTAQAERALEIVLQAERMMGGFDGLVNNAAVGTEQFGKGYDPWDITPDEWSAVNDVNLKGTFFMMQAAVNRMIETGRKGNVLNIASNAACMDITGPYGSSKLSVLKLTRAMGKRFGSEGIVINGIAPGATLTPMISRYAHSADQPYPRHAIERFILPEEIAELAFYLMSDYGEIICGHTVVADGGDNAATL